VVGIIVSFYQPEITLIIYIGVLVFLTINSTIGYRIKHESEIHT
jgi:hypothetical protein